MSATAAERLEVLAQMIDACPGMLESSGEVDAVLGEWDGGVDVLPLLREMGYRDIPEPVNGPRLGTEPTRMTPDWRWWPSRARCADLARTATGDRRERLLRGMLL